MSYTKEVSTHVVDGVTTMDCQRQVRSWRLLRSIIEFLIPKCTCYYLQEQEVEQERRYLQNYYHYPRRYLMSTTTTVTGTIFGYRRGKVSICIQSSSNSTVPILLLELPVATAALAKEMKSGLLRITLECSVVPQQNSSSTLLSVSVWTMYCNGKKAGCAVRRRPKQTDIEVLRLMRNVYVGTGVINGKTLNCDDEIMYLRANFQRISRSSNAESFHLISPDGSTGQELSVFFLRST